MISINDYEEVNDPGTLDTRVRCECNSQRIMCSSEDRALQFSTKASGDYIGRYLTGLPTNPKELQ